MKITFPAMRGQIGGRTYYSCMMQLAIIPKMFTFREWAEFRPEDREQRVLNENRIPQIAKYILDNEDGYLFASITASYKCEVKFKSIGSSEDLGMLEMEFDQANFVINDGQHRCAAIASALKDNPSIGDETISVLLFPYENRGRVQQMFSDLNRFVAKTSKSLDILYDKRDPLSQVTMRIAEIIPVFQGMLDKDAVSIPARSSKLFTLSALYDANSELFRWPRNEKDDDVPTVNEMVDVGSEFWHEVSASMPDWGKVKAEHLRAIELRQESICSHTVVLRAIGATGAELLKTEPVNWKERLKLLQGINWSKQNRDWEGVCMVANSVVSNRQARAATKAYIKNKLRLPLSDSEMRAISAPANIVTEVAG
jgi:DNA sulfur modification protein DndB